MATFTPKFGIKEVADVGFYTVGTVKVDGEGQITATAAPVLKLDTLKVSNIEFTAEQAEARGGKGNAALIMWDYGKEINVTLEDALFSAKSMAIMFGNGRTKGIKTASDTDVSGKKILMKTVVFMASDAAAAGEYGTLKGSKRYWEDANGFLHEILKAKYFDENGNAVANTALVKGTKYFCTFDIEVQDDAVIEISANSFPGTWTNIMSALAGNKIMLNYLVNCWKPYK